MSRIVLREAGSGSGVPGPAFASDMPFAGVRVPRVISVISILVALIVLVWRWRSIRREG